jgi:GDPmannose 4,6-dehydratase
MGDRNFSVKYYDLHDAHFINHILQQRRSMRSTTLQHRAMSLSRSKSPTTLRTVSCRGTLNILNAIKNISPTTRMYQASSSEMFGDSTDYTEKGYNENSRMMPVSPYAVAKLYGHQMVNVYRKAYGLHLSSGILFNHESPRRGETFVTGKITMAAAKIKKGMQKDLRPGKP